MRLEPFPNLTEIETSADSRCVEAYHRIANNLAQIAGSVRLQASSLERGGQGLTPAEGRRLLEEVSARIEAAARLHRILSSTSGDRWIDVGAYVNATCDALEESIASDSAVEIFCDAPTLYVATDQAQLLGLIVAELLINALKYAHPAGAPGRIEIRCRATGADGLILSVTDDGVGLPEGFDPMTDGGVGLRVVRSMVRQLSAQLEFDCDGLGLAVRVIAQPSRASDERRCAEDNAFHSDGAARARLAIG